MVIGDLNAEVDLECMKLFCKTYDLSSLIKVTACYKNTENFSCIDLILTNWPKSFQNSSVAETGLSDFHKMTVTDMKATFENRNWNEFCNGKFKTQLLTKSSLENFNNSRVLLTNSWTYVIILLTYLHPARKSIWLRGHNMSFISKT